MQISQNLRQTRLSMFQQSGSSLELSSPYRGFMRTSDAPLRTALSVLGR